MADRHRLTIFHDDRSFRDRRERLLDDMRRQVDDDLRRFGFGRHHWSTDLGGGGGGGGAWGRDRKDADPIGRLMSHDFFRLRPSSPLSAARRDEFGGSGDSLDDDATVRGLLTDVAPAPSTPGGSGRGAAVASGGSGSPRLFSMSFDVKEYDAEDISVTVEEQTMTVRATHRAERDGAVSVKEFSRKVRVTSDRRMLTRGRIEGAPPPKKTLPLGDPGSHVIHSLGPSDSTSQTASRFVHPFCR